MSVVSLPRLILFAPRQDAQYQVRCTRGAVPSSAMVATPFRSRPIRRFQLGSLNSNERGGSDSLVRGTPCPPLATSTSSSTIIILTSSCLAFLPLEKVIWDPAALPTYLSKRALVWALKSLEG